MIIRVCIISIVRTTQVPEGPMSDPSCMGSISAHCKRNGNSLYYLGTTVTISTWSTAELASGVLSACLPVLRPIYTFLVNRHSNPQGTSLPNTLYLRSSSSASTRNRSSGFWWTTSNPDPSSDTRRKDHLPFSTTSTPPNGFEDDRWMELPISRLSPVYQRSRSRESVARIAANLEP